MEGSAIRDFVLKHTLPLVGHRKPSNDARRYTRRPLVVVYYGVDFSFDYRAGEARAPVDGVGCMFSSWLQVVFLLCSRQAGLMRQGTGPLGWLFRPRSPSHQDAIFRSAFLSIEV